MLLCVPSLLSSLALAADPPSESVERLRRASSIPVEARFEDGFPRSVRVDVAVAADTLVDQAFEYLEQHAAFYGLSDPRGQLVVDRLRGDRLLGSVHFRQVAGGRAVDGASLVVTLLDGRVRGTAGALVPDLGPIREATIDRATAEGLATAEREGLVVGRSTLEVVATDGGAREAWRVAVRQPSGPSLLWLDGQTGKVLQEVSERAEAKDIIVQTAQFTDSSNCWDWAWEGQDTTWFEEDGASDQYDVDDDGFLDGMRAWENGHDLYDWWQFNFGRDSYNDGGAQLNFMVDVGIPTGGNAYWDVGCGHMAYFDGWVTDDVTAHELGHALDSYEAGLIYQLLPGAVDESFADVYAALYDPDDSWLGEEIQPSVGGGACPAIRSLSQPGICGQPDHLSELLTLPDGVSPNCDMASDDYNDCGWVHSNSGILNKAAWLLMEGGSWYGYEVNPIGRDKVAQLYYYVHTEKLFSTSGFFDVRNALVFAAEDFVDAGLADFEDEDVCEVRNAFAAVGIMTWAADQDCDGTLDGNDADDDGDLTIDGEDNCLNEYNPTQSDIDGDGFGDACDSDMDGDGDKNTVDNCPEDPNASQADSDGDGIGNACDDSDGDGVLDIEDNCPGVYNGGQADQDGDDVGDACDDDLDGDGTPNGKDVCPDLPDDQTDTDGDGLGDPCDNCDEVPNPDQKDCDEDGIGQACEPQGDPDTYGLGCENFDFREERLWVHPLDMVALPVCDGCAGGLPQDWRVEVVGYAGDGSPLRVVDDRGYQVGVLGREGLQFEPSLSSVAELGRTSASFRRYFLEVSPEASPEGVELTLSVTTGL